MPCCHHNYDPGCRCVVPHDARPIDTRPDRPFRNLNSVMDAGKRGLSETFPIGSIWEVGPFVSGKDPEVVEIIGSPYTSGVNYSHQPDDRRALGKGCWFIKTRRLWSPHGEHRLGLEDGTPPHTLSALTPRMAAKIGRACCDCACYVPPCHGRVLSCNAGVVQSQRAEIEALNDDLHRTLNRLDAAERKLSAVRDAAKL